MMNVRRTEDLNTDSMVWNRNTDRTEQDSRVRHWKLLEDLGALLVEKTNTPTVTSSWSRKHSNAEHWRAETRWVFISLTSCFMLPWRRRKLSRGFWLVEGPERTEVKRAWRNSTASQLETKTMSLLFWENWTTTTATVCQLMTVTVYWWSAVNQSGYCNYFVNQLSNSNKIPAF